MIPDLETQLRQYGTQLDEMAPRPTAPEHVHRQQVRPWRAVAVAVAAAVMVLVFIGGVALLASRAPDEPTRPATDPTVTTTGPSTTVAPDITTTSEATPPESPPAAVTVPASALAEGFTWGTDMVFDRWGGFAAVYWSESDGAIKLLRCLEPGCAEPRDVVIPGTSAIPDDQHGELVPLIEDLELLPNGAPIVIVSGERTAVYVCGDAECSSMDSSTFGEGDAVLMGTPRLAIAPDGSSRIAYLDVTAPALRLAICEDALCGIGARTVVTIHDVLIPGEPWIEITADGRVFVGYETMREGEPYVATVAVCADDTCSTEPVIHALGEAVVPRWTHVDAEGFKAWYRLGPEIISEGDLDTAAMLEGWELIVADCASDGCSNPIRIDAGWELLMAWGARDDLVLIDTPNGTVAAVYSYWSPEQCSTLIDVAILDPQQGTTTKLATYTGGAASVSLTPDAQLLVAYQTTAGELNIARLPLTSEDPADRIPNLPDMCPQP